MSLKNISQTRQTKRPRAFTVQSLGIHNLKNIAHLEIDFTKHSSLAGQWRCIAGINGAGKSTVLQAIACVLLGERLLPELGGRRLSRMCRRQPSEDSRTEIHARVSNGQESCELYIPLGPEGLELKLLEAHPRYKEMREFWDWRMHNHLLVSYGAGRNLSEDVQVDIGKDKSAEVRRQFTLFEPLAQVAHADVLLREDRMPAVALRHLHKLLAELLRDSPLQLVPESEPLLFNVGGATVSTAELPDGFRALVTWVADLCANWYDKAPEDAEQDDLSLLEGIVLLDEIDLHLHPSLQRTLVPRLRRLLPGVQWIVTTHSPLVLVSFDSNELVPLEGFSGGVRQLDRQILSFSTDEVYRWLMRTEPTSAAMEELWNAPEQNGLPRLGALMAQSPELSEEDIELNEQWLKQRQADLEKGGSDS